MTRRSLLQAALARPGLPFQRGVNFTAEAPAFYGSDAASGMLRQLPAYGVDSIALIPYGMARPGAPEVRFNPTRSWERDTGLQRLAAEAHELGIRILLKPQVWVRRSFPGDLRFDEPLALAAWFASYRGFIEHYAKLAQTIKADLFCVGTEFVLLSRHATEWRRTIERVRALYRGPLVYAANFGPEFEQLPFWDAVDYIGLNNYYPLAGDLSYANVLRRVEAVHRAARRPVIFTEAGFASLTDAHLQPWDESPRGLSMQHQARCYEALLQAFYDRPWLHGIYFWKVGTNGFGGPSDGSHTPWGKPAMDVVKRWYRDSRRRALTPPASPARSSPDRSGSGPSRAR